MSDSLFLVSSCVVSSRTVISLGGLLVWWLGLFWRSLLASQRSIVSNFSWFVWLGMDFPLMWSNLVVFCAVIVSMSLGLVWCSHSCLFILGRRQWSLSLSCLRVWLASSYFGDVMFLLRGPYDWSVRLVALFCYRVVASDTVYIALAPVCVGLADVVVSWLVICSSFVVVSFSVDALKFVMECWVRVMSVGSCSVLCFVLRLGYFTSQLCRSQFF